MAIQFQCAKCHSPIEVDDDAAGRLATCPYCDTVVNVPTESMHLDTPVEARPANLPPQPGMPPLPTEDQDAAQRSAARSWAIGALVCTGLMLACVFGMLVAMMSILMQNHSPAEIQQMDQAEMTKLIEQVVTDKPWLGVLQIGSLFFGLAGLGLATMSLRIRTNWMAWVALPICGLYMLCNCGGLLL